MITLRRSLCDHVASRAAVSRSPGPFIRKTRAHRGFGDSNSRRHAASASIIGSDGRPPTPKLRHLGASQSPKQNAQVVFGFTMVGIERQDVAEGLFGGFPVAAFLKQDLTEQYARAEGGGVAGHDGLERAARG